MFLSGEGQIYIMFFPPFFRLDLFEEQSSLIEFYRDHFNMIRILPHLRTLLAVLIFWFSLAVYHLHVLIFQGQNMYAVSVLVLPG